MAIDISDWTKTQYHAFLLVCAAHSNYNVSEEERLYIVNVTGEKDFKFAETEYQKCSDFECVNIISKGKKQFYPGEHDKLLLESELKTLFAADHEFESLESNFLRYIDKVL